MQYHIQTLVKHLFDKDSFEQVTVQELKQFTDEYPYAAVGQFLYAKKLKDGAAYNNHEQCEQASLYFHNSLWLRWQLDQKEEAPALPRADEQQPGFRIVVQMPKAGQPAYVTPPLTQPEEKLEELTIQDTTGATEATPDTEQPAAEQIAATAAETPEAAGTSLQVNEDGSLVEQAAGESAPEQTSETPAETSQLAEENTTEAALNAVSITEETLTPAAGTTEPDEIIPAVEATPLDIEKAREQDEIVPAVEALPLELEQARTEDEIIPAVEAAPLDIEKAREQDDIVPAIEVIPEPPATVTDTTVEEQSPADVTPATSEMPPAEIAIGEMAATGVELEEQPVTAATERLIEEPAAITAETEQPATEEPVVDNTTVRPPTAPVREEPEAAAVTAAQAIPGETGGRPDQTTVDLGEPIFESYHTIDYFASQGVKLMQDDLKDRLGKKMKSFTDWLRSMKRIGPIESNTSLDEVTNQSIQRIAEHSVEEKEVLTEAMAEVWAKQGNAAKAIRVYEKLSLLNPAKSPYFAGRIEQLKAQ